LSEPTVNPQPEPIPSPEGEPLNGPTHLFRPSLLGSWFLFLGALLGPAIIVLNRDPQDRTGLWLGLTGLMVGLIIHRLGLSYHFDGLKLQVHSWWGLGRTENLALVDLAQASVHYSFSLRLVGLGHLYLTSRQPWESGITLLAQRRPEDLAASLNALAKASQGAETALANPSVDPDPNA
jgi:hypothetical protein